MVTDKLDGAIENAFITDKVRKASDSYELTSPGSGQLIATVASCTPDDARASADLAVSSFHKWRKRTAFERSEIVRRWYELMVDNKDQLGRIIATEMGKPVREATGEAVYAANFAKFYAEEAIRVYGEIGRAHV